MDGAPFFCRFEHVANTGGTNADEHFDEFRSADVEKRDIGLSGCRSCEKGFPCSWWSHQKNPFWNIGTRFSKFFRVLEVIHDFAEVILRVIQTGNLLVSDITPRFFETFCPGFSDAEKASLSQPFHLFPHFFAHTQNIR